MIGDRRAAILNIIIDNYIDTGEPMGSKTLSNLLPYQISSATIRNEMAYLSSLGFLEQRHTSGGRVPSKEAYRFYVDNLLKPIEITDFEKEKINEVLSVNASDPERLLKNAAELLAEASHSVAFYTTVEDEFDCIQGVDLIPAGNGKAMLVMLSVGGRIKSSVCKVSCPIDNEFKSLFYHIMSEYFIGTPLADVNLALIQSTVPSLGGKVFDMLPVLTSLCSISADAAKPITEVVGETNLLSQDELGDGVYRLLSFLTAKDQFNALLSQFVKYGKNMELFIGSENKHPELRDTATAVAKFTYNNNQKATIGIINSIRMDYQSVLPRVEYIMNTVSEFLQKGGVTFE